MEIEKGRLTENIKQEVKNGNRIERKTNREN